jgi:hypothetical protein
MSDAECVACAKAACCPELDACVDDMVCYCLLLCVLGGETPENCQMSCGENMVSQAVVDCGDLNCPVCG